MTTRKLTPKQRRFAGAWRGNNTAAARDAGYRGSDSTLAALGCRLIRDPRVKAIIAERQRASELPDLDRDDELPDLDPRATFAKIARDPTISPAVRLSGVERYEATKRRERPDVSAEARFAALRDAVAVEVRALRQRQSATCPTCGSRVDPGRLEDVRRRRTGEPDA